MSSLPDTSSHKCAFVPVPRPWLLSPFFVQRSFVCWWCGLLLTPFRTQPFLLPRKGSRDKAHCYSPRLGSRQRAQRGLPGTQPLLAASLPACLRHPLSLCLSLLLPLLQSVLSVAAVLGVPQSPLQTNPGETCLPGHGCGLWVVFVGVYFHKTNELDDPVVSIVLGCLNYLWIRGF